MALTVLQMMIMMKTVEVLMVKVLGQWDGAIGVSHHSLKMHPKVPPIMMVMIIMIKTIIKSRVDHQNLKYYEAHKSTHQHIRPKDWSPLILSKILLGKSPTD